MPPPPLIDEMDGIRVFSTSPQLPIRNSKLWSSIKRSVACVGRNRRDAPNQSSEILLSSSSTPTPMDSARSDWSQKFSNLMSFLTGHNEQRVHNLKPCKTRKIKCCNPKIGKLSALEIMIFMEHWFQHVQVLDTRNKDNGIRRMDVVNVADELFLKDVVDAILRMVKLVKPIGILNESNDCFAIVVLQAMIACPPFLYYVANKPLGSTLREKDLNFAVRSMLAQYISGFYSVNCRRIINHILPNITSRDQEDAQKFFEGFANAYLGSMAKVHSYYIHTCVNCEVSIETGGIDNHITLDWPKESVFESMTISERIRQSRETKFVGDWKCDNCRKDGCKLQSRYEFGDVILTILDTRCDSETRSTSTEFMPVEDFGPLTVSGEKCQYNLAAVIFYQRGCSIGGHYTAQTYHNGICYVNDDKYCNSLDCSNRRLRGKPYFAIYYNEKLKGLSNVEGSPTPEECKKETTSLV